MPTTRCTTLAVLGLLILATACTRQETASAGTETAAVDPVTPADAPGDATAAIEPAAAPVPGTPAAPVYRVFRDVVVACDNVRRCAAIGVSDGAPGLVFTLTREAGADGGQVLVLRAPWGDLDAAMLQLDGASAPALLALPWQHDADESQALRIEDPQAITRFVDLVRNRARLGDGRERSVSLSGFNAALLYIDEHQQRLDTPGAWARRGERDSAGVPAAPALPVLARAASTPPALSDSDAQRLVHSVRTSQSGVLRAEDCEASGGTYDIARQDTAVPLDAAHALVFIACYSGAYQGASLAFRAARDGSDVARLTLPGLAMSDDSERSDAYDLLVSPGFDPVTGVLSQYAKGRGIGDCGYLAAWQFDGRAFHLAHYAEMQQCGGLTADDWPVLWRVAGPAAAP